MTPGMHNILATVLIQSVLACLLWFGIHQDAHAEVLIEGIEPQIRDNILAYMRLDDEACDAPSWRIRRLFADSDNQIREALEVVGYYNVDIDKTLDLTGTCWQARFTITLGQPVVLRDVSINIDTSGAVNSEMDKVVANCAIQTGDVLSHASYEACKRRITRAAKNRGYFSSRFAEQRIDVVPDQYAADVRLHFVTGPRYVFGAITFDQDVLDPDLIHRFVRIEPGEPYDAERVRRLQRYLVTSAYFDQVLLTRDPRGEPHNDVPIHIELTPGKKHQYNAGIGFATDVGPRLRFGVLNRRRNKHGHQTEFELNLSKVISDVGVTYRIPLYKPQAWFTTDAGFKYVDNDCFWS